MAVTYTVSGMSCEGCVAALTSTLSKGLGTDDVVVKLDGQTATVPDGATAEQVKVLVEQAGFAFVGPAEG